MKFNLKECIVIYKLITLDIPNQIHIEYNELSPVDLGVKVK